MGWYLACHKTGKHNAFKLQMFLARINVDVFIPQSCRYRPREDRPGHLRPIIEPLFPGYIFLHFDPEETHTSKISSCPGFGHFIRFGGIIKSINNSIINNIMQMTFMPSIKNKPENDIDDNNENQLSVSNSQCDVIKSIFEERDGNIRGALFYSYIETLSR